MFGPLHTTSHFSFLAGASSPEELVRRSAQLGHTAFVLTDFYGMYGAVELQRACKKYNIKPVLGCTVRVDGFPLVLIAKNMNGYAVLCEMLTQKFSSGEEWNLEDISCAGSSRSCAGNCAGSFAGSGAGSGGGADVVVLTGGRHSYAYLLAKQRKYSALKEWLRTLQRCANAPVYAELTHHHTPWCRGVAHAMHSAARELDMPCVIGTDARYAERDSYALYDAMTCMRKHKNVFEPDAERPVNDDEHLRSKAELAELLPYPDAFANTARLLEECEFNILPDHVTPPAARLQPGETAVHVLRSTAWQAYKHRYANACIKVRAQQQLRHELRVIEELELADFFLVVKEVVDEAKRRGIRCSGRGSAANSIVAYLLGITGVCPIEHNLLFERFLHGGRKGTPDIDVDFDSERRGEIIAWMEERFGIEHTAMTATLITYQPRMAVRDVAKALGWTAEMATQMSGKLPHFSNKNLEVYRHVLEEVTGPAPLVDTLIHTVQNLLGRPRHLGQHSGGMVLSRIPLHKLTPVQRSANGVKVVQFAKDDVEAMGLVKLDVLGLRMLACISETLELIEQAGKPPPNIDELPLDDAEVYGMIQRGQTLGVFQIESQGQMHLLAQHQPQNFNDLVVEVAIFRPGPLQGGMVHPYIRRRKGLEAVEYLHPALEPILKDTLGIILFQEQILEIAHKFAGLPLHVADDFRSVVSKNRDSAAIQKMHKLFVEGAIERGIPAASAQLVFDKVSLFVGYGFCRSHAAAFAKIVYQSAWLKNYFPAEYMASFMQHRPGFYNLMTLEEETRRCGVSILLPDINISGVRYSVEQREQNHPLTVSKNLSIRKPLTQVRNLTAEAAAEIVMERLRGEYVSVEDLWRRTTVSVAVLEQLAVSGALDALSGSTRNALWEVGVVHRRGTAAGIPRGHEAQPLLLFKPTLLRVEDLPALPNITAKERLAYDYTSHGAGRLHPMTLYRRTMNALEVRSIETCYRLQGTSANAGTITIGGIVILRQSPPTAHGVLFITLEDETGFIQCVVQPNERSYFRNVLHNSALIVKGKLHAVGGWRGVVLVDAWPMGQLASNNYQLAISTENVNTSIGTVNRANGNP